MFRRVGALEELWTGEMRGYVVDGRKVLLVRLEDGVRAFEDRCAHLGMPISGGKLEGERLVCSAHHYEYDARTGQGVNPKRVCLRAYPVCVDGGEVSVDLEGALR